MSDIGGVGDGWRGCCGEVYVGSGIGKLVADRRRWRRLGRVRDGRRGEQAVGREGDALQLHLLEEVADGPDTHTIVLVLVHVLVLVLVVFGRIPIQKF